MQDSLKSSLESSTIPAFEQSQVDAAFRKGMTEHTAAAQPQLEASHTPLAHTLTLSAISSKLMVMSSPHVVLLYRITCHNI